LLIDKSTESLTKANATIYCVDYQYTSQKFAINLFGYDTAKRSVLDRMSEPEFSEFKNEQNSGNLIIRKIPVQTKKACLITETGPRKLSITQIIIYHSLPIQL
jgi:hypothetical protein